MMINKHLKLYILLSVLGLFFVQCSIVNQFRYPSLKSIMDFTGLGDPRWSSDGTQIVFDGPGGELFIVNSDGTNRKSLKEQTGFGYTPDWSPDSKRIVFASRENRSMQIYTITLNSGKIVQLTHLSSASFPRWSPDGKKIAFCTKGSNKEEEGIYVMDEDGTNASQLTHYPIHDACAYDWSLDSTQLVFTAINDSLINDGQNIQNSSSEPGFHMYVMNADGSDIRQLNNGMPGTYPTWSPDGKQILYNSFSASMPLGFYITALDGSGGRKIFDSTSCDQLHWSSKTNHILYVCLTGLQTTQLFTVDMKDVLK